MRIILFMLITSVLVSCGQSGKLYLPWHPEPNLPAKTSSDHGEKV